MRILKLVILLFSLHATTAFSQELNFININTDMGLPSNESYRIIQDSKGYMWISTDAGLVKYNSKEFTLFNTRNGMPSNNDVYALDADKYGRVWFATGTWKIGYIRNDSVFVLPELDFYNKETKNGDLIYKIKYNDATNSLFVSSHFQTVEVSKIQNTYVSRGIQQNGKKNDYALLDNDYVANLFDKPFITSGRKEASLLLHLSNRGIPLVPFTHIFFAEAFSAPLSQDFFFIGIMNETLLVDKKQGIVSQKTKLFTQIQSLFVDAKKNLWVGCKKNGLFLFTGGNISKKPLHLLNDISVSNITEDREGGIWATTLEKGVFYCPNTSITVTGSLLGSNNGITFSKVVNGKLFLSNDAVPLAAIDKDTVYLKAIGNEIHPKVTDIVHFSNGYYLSTFGGLYFIDKELKKVTPVYTPYFTYTLKPFLSGYNGIIGTPSDTFYIFNNVNINRLLNSQVRGIISNNPKVTHGYLLNSHQILFCSKFGLYIETISANTSTTKKIITQGTLSIHDVNRIYKDGHGNFWLPSNSDSLNILDKDFNLKTSIPLTETNISCRNVLQVNPTSFLACTNKGLLKINFTDTTFKKYTLENLDKSNGLLSSDVYNVVQFENSFYVSSSKGLCKFSKVGDLLHNSYPNTVINRITVNDSSIALHGSPVLSHTKNNLTFRVDALAFKRIAQRGTFFKYRLDGLEKDFRPATGNVVNYDNLPPGNYTFIAKTFYDDNTEDTTPATFSFTIRPAFWQTWWGMLLMVSVGIAVIFMFIQFRIRKIKGAEKEKAAINQTIAEYRFTALKAQMDPHFVFNSINVIQNLILEKDKTEAYNSLGKFSRLIRMILNQSDSVFATIEEELALINLYVELNQLRIDYSFTFSSQIEPQLMSCNIPSLIIQPFIENALWHGILPLKGAKEGKISLRILMEANDVLVIQVEDNGIGRKASSSNKSSIHISKGINLIRERLKAYQSMNNDCLAELNIVDLEENDGAAGTLVEIKIAIPNDEA